MNFNIGDIVVAHGYITGRLEIGTDTCYYLNPILNPYTNIIESWAFSVSLSKIRLSTKTEKHKFLLYENKNNLNLIYK